MSANAVYEPSGDAVLAFLEAAVTVVTESGKTNSLDVGAGLQAAVAVDGAPLLRYLLTALLSTRTGYALTVNLEGPDILSILGLSVPAEVADAARQL